MKKIFIIFALLLSAQFRSAGQDIYTYLNTDISGAPSYWDPLLLVHTNLSPIGTTPITPCTWGFSGISGFIGTFYDPLGPCVEITLSANPGYTIDATRFLSYLRRSSTGPNVARLAYSTNGTTWIDQGFDHNPTNGSCATSLGMTTAANWNFAVTNATLYFRIYPYNASGSSGTIQVYELHIEGTVRLACTTPTITVTPSSAGICAGGTGAALTASGALAGGTYSWHPGTGLSSTFGATVTANPAVTTTYTVVGRTIGGCRDSAAVTVTVNPSPTATITPAGPTTFCIGNFVTLNANVSAGYTYQWHVGSSPIVGATNSSYTAGTTGNYHVDITNSFGCTTSSTAVTVTTIPAPTATVAAGGPTTFCLGGSVLLTGAAGAGYSYQWFRAGIAISGATNSSYLVTTSGIYSTLVTGPTGCTANSPLVSVNAVPLPFIDTSGPTTFCAGNTNVLTANVGSASSGITYQWQRNGTNIPGATSSNYYAITSGTYACTVNIGGSCISTTPAKFITVHPVPLPAVAFNGVRFYTSSIFTSYQWYLNTVGIPGATTPSVTPTVNGSYRVRVTDNNGCAAYSPAYSLFNLAVNEAGNGHNIKIYPNPANDYVHISSPAAVNITIAAIDGKTITTVLNTKEADMDISTLAAGVYLVRITDAEGTVLTTEKLIKH